VVVDRWRWIGWWWIGGAAIIGEIHKMATFALVRILEHMSFCHIIYQVKYVTTAYEYLRDYSISEIRPHQKLNRQIYELNIQVNIYTSFLVL
jgi:hypothetical protein